MKLLRISFAIAIAISVYSCTTNSGETEGEMETDGMEQAKLQEFIMTRDPQLNTVPTERILVAQQKMNSLLAARGMNIQALTWQERGPNNVGGRTRAIMIDNRDPSGNTVFAASVSGGIFKTTTFNTTYSWSPVNDQMANLAVTCMVQSSATPTIMYAGTGEGWFNVDAVKGAGMFKSVDGGTTWTRLSSTSGWEYVQDVVIDNNGNVYASLRNASSNFRGVMRSTDGGNSWTQVLGLPLPNFTTGRAADLEVAPNGDIYATLGIFSRSQIMKSDASNGANTGALNTWIDITPQHTTVTQRAELAIAPSNSQRLYLIMQDSSSSQVSTVYRSYNAGTTWDSLPAPAALNNNNFSQNWYNLIAAVDPSNPDVIVLGGYHVARSTDAGANWSNITAPSQVHVDQHVLVYASSSKLIVGNDGGIYSSDNVNSGSPTFTKKNNGFNVTQFYGVDFHPTQTDYFLAGAQDNNTQQFGNAGMNSTSAVVGGDGGFPHVRQSDGFLQIASTTGNNYYRSLNSGSSFSFMNTVSNNRGQFINPTDLADNQNVLYCGDDAGKYYCITNLDGTPTGFSVTVGSIGSNREVSAVKVDPFTPNVVWLGTTSLASGVIPNIIKVGNANTNSPTILAVSTIGVPAGSYISSIDVDPNNGNHLIATVSNYGTPSVFESTNGGTSWSSIEGDLPDMPVYWGIFAPANALLSGAVGTPEGGIILGTELGIWTTSEIGGPFTQTQWIPNNSGFPNVRTDMVRYRPSDRLLVAATHGRGLFTTHIAAGTSTVGVSNLTATKDFIKYIASVNNRLVIVPGNLNTRKIDLQVFDLGGRLVYRGTNAYQTTTISTAGWSKGSYVIKIKGDRNEIYSKQFLKQ
jgi:hypothetical protein